MMSFNDSLYPTRFTPIDMNSVPTVRPLVSPQYTLNDYLGDYLRTDMQRKAKERRMKRMMILMNSMTDAELDGGWSGERD